MDGIGKALEATDKVLKTIPDIYGDTLQPIAKETGKTGA